MAKDVPGHRFRFFRVGGLDQVRLDSGGDLLALPELDQKLWVALSCPVKGLEFDAKTLELIDTDQNGRIRAPEILAAVKWAGSVLKSADTLVKGLDALPLSAIDDEGEEGRRLLSSAKQILANLGKKGQKTISVEDTADTARIFAQTRFNGDGIVPVTSAEDDEGRRAIQDIIDCVGSEVDRSGLPGVSQALVDRFFAEAEAHAAWWRAADADAARVLPLGEATAAAAEAWRKVAAKVDDYFARVRLSAFDPRAVGPLNRDVSEYGALAAKELSPAAPEVASFPIAQVEAHRALPLVSGVNPAWAEPLARLRAEVVAPLLGERDALTDAEWATLGAKLAPYEAWRAGKAGAGVEKLGRARVFELIDAGAKAKVEALIEKDRALEPEANAIASVDRLIRYVRDLRALLDNFVSFRDFYSGKKKAIFQAGTLYLDGRSCDLTLQVNDVAAHSAVAIQSGTYLVYCECTRRGGDGEKMSIVAAVTAGHAGGLMAGRNGLFYDRKGADWDATVVKLVEHPISIREAFWAPYRRVAKLVGEQVAKLAAARDKDIHDKAAANVATAGAVAVAPLPGIAAPAAPAAPAPAPSPAAPAASAAPPTDIARFAGIFAAIGLAVGAVGTALGAVVTGFLSMAFWQMPLALGGVLLVISGPSMLLAWLKIRARNIGPILDANGWAVNSRARMNILFGASLTALAELPPNAERSLDDPFEEERSPWVRRGVVALVVVAALLAHHLGWAARWVDALRARPFAPPASSASASASAAPAAPPK